MQRSLPDSRAGDVHRFQHGVRVDTASPAHVDANVQQPGYLLHRRKLIGNRPARLPAHDAKMPLVVKIVHLHDHTVGSSVQVLLCVLYPVLVEGYRIFRSLYAAAVGADFETKSL